MIRVGEMLRIGGTPAALIAMTSVVCRDASIHVHTAYSNALAKCTASKWAGCRAQPENRQRITQLLSDQFLHNAECMITPVNTVSATRKTLLISWNDDSRENGAA